MNRIKGVVVVLVVFVVASLVFLQFDENRNQMALLTGLIETSLRQIDGLRDRQEAGEHRSHLAGERLSNRLTDLEDDIELQARHRDLVSTELHSIRESMHSDIDRLHEDVMSPSVQVTGGSGVGGGVVVYSHGNSKRDSESYVVTAFHVVQKVVYTENGQEKRDPVEVKFYGRDERTLKGELVLYDKKQDIALIRVPGTGVLPSARLAKRETLKRIRVFTPVIAVGCPLGHDPLPSRGEISTLHKEVDGANFWMMNAPTIYGNSGGGIFHGETHELIGISAMICTFDNRGTTPVPHMGILVSLETVYDWLDMNLYQFVYDKNYSSEACAKARRSKLRPAKNRVEW